MDRHNVEISMPAKTELANELKRPGVTLVIIWEEYRNVKLC